MENEETTELNSDDDMESLINNYIGGPKPAEKDSFQISTHEKSALDKKIDASKRNFDNKKAAIKDTFEYFLTPFMSANGYKIFNETQKREKALYDRATFASKYIESKFDFNNKYEAEVMIGNTLNEVLAPKSSGEEWDFGLDLEAELSNIKIDWICRDLGMAPGDSFAAVAESFTGKTYFASYLALCFISGKSIFGKYEVQKTGKIAHLNWDSSSDITRTGYIRLALGMGISLKKGDIFYEKPTWKMHQENAYENLTEICKGKIFCIIDSLRACYDGEENGSESASVIALANRVSEETGCTIFFIAHTGKAGVTKGLNSIRGSSATPAALGAEWSLEKTSEDRTIKITCHKGRLNQFAPICYKYSEEGNVAANIGKSFKVVMSLAEGACSGPNDKKDIPTQIKEYLYENGKTKTSKLKDEISGRAETINKFIKQMVTEGKLIAEEDPADGRSTFVFLSEAEETKLTEKK